MKRSPAQILFGKMVGDPNLHAPLLWVAACGLGLILLSIVGFSIGYDVVFNGGLPNNNELLLVALISVALVTVSLDRPKIAVAAGAFAWIYGIAAFARTVDLISSGTVGEQLSAGLTIAPNSAIGIASIGLALAITSRDSRFRLQVHLGACAAFVAVSLGLIAVWGHIAEVRGGYGWGRFPPMSALQACWLVSSGLILGRVLQQRIISRESRRVSSLIPVAVATTMAALLLSAALLEHQGRTIRQALDQELNDLGRRLELAQERLLFEVNSAGHRAFLLALSTGGASKDSDLVIEPAVTTVSEAKLMIDKRLDRVEERLKEFREEGLKEFLKGSRVFLTSSPTVDSAGIRRITIARHLVDGSPSSGVIVATIDVEQFLKTALGRIDPQVAAEVRFLKSTIWRSGNPVRAGAADASEIWISLFDANGWSVELRPTSGFVRRYTAVHPLILPVALILFVGMLAAVRWLSDQVSRREALIQAQQEAIAELELYRERARDVLTVTDDSILTVDIDERTQFANRAAIKLYGEQRSGETFLSDFLSLQELEVLRREAFHHARQGIPWSGSIRRGDAQLILRRVIGHRSLDGIQVGYTILDQPQLTVAPATIDPKDPPLVSIDSDDFVRSDAVVWITAGQGVLPMAASKEGKAWIDADPALGDRLSEKDRSRYTEFLTSAKSFEIFQAEVSDHESCWVLALGGTAPEVRVFLHWISQIPERTRKDAAGADLIKNGEETVRQVQRFVAVIAKAAQGVSVPPEILENIELVQERMGRLDRMFRAPSGEDHNDKVGT